MAFIQAEVCEALADNQDEACESVARSAFSEVQHRKDSANGGSCWSHRKQDQCCEVSISCGPKVFTVIANRNVTAAILAPPACS